jgi:hypothetical protein
VNAFSAFQSEAKSPTAYPKVALIAARLWAENSCQNGDFSSALEGYSIALEILPKVAWLGLSISSRHDWRIKEKSEDLVCSSVACAIQLGHLKQAMELLDAGRSYYWQQASALRQNLEQLKEENPELARELNDISWRLEQGSFPGSFLALGGPGIGSSTLRTEDIGRERRHLAGTREEIVNRIRQLPNFTNFLRPTPFPVLRSAITTGKVIINVSRLRVDALVVDNVQPIQHIPLPNINLEIISDLSNKIQNRLI